MIKNIEFTINRTDFTHMQEVPRLLDEKYGSRILRWFVSKVTDAEVCVEITLSETEEYPFPTNRREDFYPGKSVVVNIIPTGIGCEIGGYAADAAPITNMLASCSDYLITNPNAVNASNFISMDEKTII